MKVDVAPTVISVTHGRYMLEVVAIGDSELCVVAEGMPPAVVAHMLVETGAGRLVDYDQAVMSGEWWNELQSTYRSGAPKVEILARVIY